MTAYQAEFTVTDQVIIDADSLEEAFEKAAEEAAIIYDVDGFQIDVRFAKELN